MGHRAKSIPSVRCHATSSKTGKPCARWAKPGLAVCAAHGGKAPQTERAARVRLTLAELLAADPRDPRTVLLDALATADAIFREGALRVRAGETLTAAELDRLIQNFSRAATLAKTAIDSRLTETVTRNRELEGQLLGHVLSAVLDRLQLTPEWRAYALQLATHELTTTYGGANDDLEPPAAPDDPLMTDATEWAAAQPDSHAPGTTGPGASDGTSATDDGSDGIVDAEIVDEEPEEAVLLEIEALRSELRDLGVDPDTVVEV